MRVCLLLLTVAAPSAALAQGAVTVGGDGGTAGVTLGPGTGSTQRGALIGGVLGAASGPVFLTARYAQGSLTGNALPTTTLVQGQLQLGVAPLRWLSVSAGPQVFALENPQVERWLLWEGTVRLTAPLVGDLAESYVEGRRSFAGDVNFPGGSPNGSGIGVGLSLHPPTTPLRIGLGYQMDRVELPGGPARTIEALWLAVRLTTRAGS